MVLTLATEEQSSGVFSHFRTFAHKQIRATCLDMALVVSPASPSVQFLWSGTGGRSEVRQDQEDRVVH